MQSCLILSFLFAVCLWPSEEALAYWCTCHGDLFSGKVVVELGSGVGLAGMAVAACTDAARVVLTDGCEETVQRIR